MIHLASNKGLGKGLGALLGDFEEVTSENTPYKLLPIHRVEPNPAQPAGILTRKNCNPWQIPLPSMG